MGNKKEDAVVAQDSCNAPPPDDVTTVTFNWSSSNSSVATLTYAYQVLTTKIVGSGSATGSAQVQLAWGNRLKTCPYPIKTATQSISSVGSLAATVSLRDSSSQQVSTSDPFQFQYNGTVGTLNLGVLAGLLGPSSKCVAGNELDGIVTPTTTTGPVTIKRFLISQGCYLGQKTTSCQGAVGDDTGNWIAQDPGGNAGTVYNLDAPGIYFNGTTATPVRIRYNFQAYAVGPDGVTPISAPLSYFVRLSCTNTGVAQLSYDASSTDNQIGLGTTPITWNLK